MPIIHKAESDSHSSIKLNSSSKTNLFFIFTSIILFGITLILSYSLLNKTGLINSETENDFEPQNVQQLIQVEVLNGCGITGVGDELTDFLRAKGIDVVKTGNYRSFEIDNSFIVDRVGNPKIAEQVADSLKLNKKFIIEELNKSYFLDLTIVIGKDYKTHLSKSGS